MAKMLGKAGTNVGAMCAYGCCYKYGQGPWDKKWRHISKKLQRIRENRAWRKDSDV